LEITAKSSHYGNKKFLNAMTLINVNDKSGCSGIWIYKISPDIKRGDAILAEASTARQKQKSHILILENDSSYAAEDLQKIILFVQKFPDAVIFGKRNFINANEPWQHRFWRKLSNFWYRLQTKQVLKDSTSSLRVYPLFIFDYLKLHQMGMAFEIETAVKSSWADITPKEVELKGYYPSAHHRGNLLKRLFTVFYITGLNIHYTMRSITPIPHRKFIASKGRGEKISIFYPFQSLKVLLTENISPKQLAFAGGMGVFLGTLPLIGLHTMLILFASNFFRLNKVTAVSSSQLCMPPIVPALCIEAGHYLRHGSFLTEISLETIGYQAVDRLFEWFLGSLFLAPLFSIMIGLVFYLMTRLIQSKKRLTA
jgi:uncharacterized protein (DUF2062 family)